jgi:O-antigen/teichoic acid export membrane protein
MMKNVFEKEREEQYWADIHLQPLQDTCVDQLPTQVSLKVVDPFAGQDSWAVDEMATWILPAVSLSGNAGAEAVTGAHKVLPATGAENHIDLLRSLVKSSGLYAIASLALPLVSLALTPFLTHSLSPADYGVLTIITTFIGLMAGITQLGLSSAFFRAYNYDYVTSEGRRSVLATTNVLLSFVSVAVAAGMLLLSPYLSAIFFGRSTLANDIALAGGVVLLQNLSVPGFAWLRAEGRPLLFSLLSISNLLVTLFTTIFFIRVLHWGVAGSLIATGCGYAWVVLCTLPVMIVHAGLKIRMEVARCMLAFGVPLILNFVSYWILQLSDRYLLSVFSSLSEVARYSVVYTVGSAMSAIVVSPFTLAWPTAMFSIARRKDAARIFTLVFRWFGLFLLFCAFAFSLAATFILDWLFPVGYRSAAPVIPIVAESIAFYGIYFIFMLGANIKRKTWLTSVFTTIAAIVNVACNLFLIPHFGAMGAATSTLIAYIVLTFAAYIVNQKLYPVPFELGRFFVALFVGVAFYLGSAFLGQHQETYIAWGINFSVLVLYGGVLFVLTRKFPGE